MSGGGLRARLGVVDDGLLRLEKTGVTALMAAMGALVFLDVVHRVATRPDGPLVRLGGRLLDAAAGAGAATPEAREALGTGLALAVWAVLIALAMRTRGSPAGRAWAMGVAGAAGLGAALWAFVALLPNGLVWSQTLALALMLWLGFAGASIAAHEGRHLALDVRGRIWPRDKAHIGAALGAAATSAFCALLLWLSLRSIAAHHGDWQATQHAGGTLVGMPVPKWAAFLSLPYGFAALTFRFGLAAWDALQGRVAEEEDEVDTAMRQLGMDREGGGA